MPPAQMTPRQRVLAALRHEEPDRVPLDIGSGTVRAEARLRIRQFAPGGGYIAGAVHNVQPHVPQRTSSPCATPGANWASIR